MLALTFDYGQAAADMSATDDTHRSARPGVRRTAAMTDVAALAGVSHQTVSRVVNGSERVRPETRLRVLAAMEQLDYRPNPAARALVTGRSRTLGVVSFDTTLYGPASTLFGIERAAHERGYFITIASLPALDRASVLDAVERLRGQGVDGILVIAPQKGGIDAVGDLPAGMPVVAVEAGRPGPIPFVEVDNHAGAVMATTHLLELGHETVWHVSGPQDWPEADRRIDGWRTALAAAGAPVPAPLLGDWSPRSGYRLGLDLARDPDVSAVFVGNDQMALGVIRALHESGREVPRDVSVVGFDDIPEAAYFFPPLTTLRQDFQELGRTSLRVLLEFMAGAPAADAGGAAAAARGGSIAPQFVLRNSTAAPR
jgi:DNA-binding LacI/PurR family transcriptional regulator